MLFETVPGGPPHRASLGSGFPPPPQAFILNTAMSSLWHSSDASAARLLAASAHWRPCIDPADQPVLASLVSATACVGAAAQRRHQLLHAGPCMRCVEGSVQSVGSSKSRLCGGRADMPAATQLVCFKSWPSVFSMCPTVTMA